MLDIGFAELLLVCVIALLVLGPERLPEAIRTTSKLLHQLRSGFLNLKRELEKEIGTDEIKRDLHNNAIMHQLKETGADIDREVEDVRKGLTDLQYDVNQDADPKSGEDKP